MMICAHDASQSLRCLHAASVACHMRLLKLSDLNTQLTVVPSDLWPVQCTLTRGTGRWSCSPAEARTSSVTDRPFNLQVERSEGGQSSGPGYYVEIGCECLTCCWGVFGARQPFCGPAHWCLITLWPFFWRPVRLIILPASSENWKPLHTWLQFGKRNLLLEDRGLRNDCLTLTSCTSAEHHRSLNSCHSFKQIS